MKIPRHAFREYDIRGVADVDLPDDTIETGKLDSLAR